MASAQVLPSSSSSSRKQGHLEAGKRRLEEFRKKKAEGRAKKVPSVGQLQLADVDQKDKLSQESEIEKVLAFDGASSQGDVMSSRAPAASVVTYDSKAVKSLQSHELYPLNDMDARAPVTSSNGSIDQHTKHLQVKLSNGPGSPTSDYTYNENWREERNPHLGFTGSESKLKHMVELEQEVDPIYSSPNNVENIRQSSFLPSRKSRLEGNGNSARDSSLEFPNPSSSLFTSSSSERSSSGLQQSIPVFPSALTRSALSSNSEDLSQSYSTPTELTQTVRAPRDETSIGGSINSRNVWFSEMGEKKLSSTFDHTVESAPWRMSGNSSSASFINSKASSVHIPSYMSDTIIGRSLPSFMVSRNVARASSVPDFSFNESEKIELHSPLGNSKVHSAELLPSSGLQQSAMVPESQKNVVNSTISDLSCTNMPSSSASVSSRDDYFLMKQQFPAANKDEDFASLEQHIEDLTQEKFSLQRALEASRALAESLAAENSSLADSFNQQGMVVNQLKSDMDQLQDEIKDQLATLEAVRLEYANAQLECSAADERAKILASEVIGLEEKALRMRSNELKLERNLENSTAEIISYKRKVSSLEKDRHDLQSTIEALKEEKKLLQSKLRKASANGIVIETGRAPAITKNVSTSTEGLASLATEEISNRYDVGTDKANTSFSNANETSFSNANETGSAVALSSGTTGINLPSGTRDDHLLETSTVIPSDQQRTINNINSLISELALEKEQLLQALAAESSDNSKLKDLNKELSHKLEGQTQRLELLTAQRMSNENIQIKAADSQSVQDNTIYTDEGDEVVERVLGWIMKLFPGGSSKRRTSKLL
ncbi:protein BLISTER-like [Aristolochia californica]|uniref:protein BLISTER-like n=1 Tax=Aristolochia californica TaxID=171875 RepID=UPI0035E054BE